jgi:hypothetical protein
MSFPFFQTGDPYETCVICLDDFAEGEKLRILPCDHGYHSKCIDPWLCKNKRICPQCRKRVFDRRPESSGKEASLSKWLLRHLGVDYTCVLDVQFGSAFHCRMRFRCHFFFSRRSAIFHTDLAE